MNLLHKKFENFYRKIFSPVHNNPNKHHTSTLPNSIRQCYDTPIDSRTKPDFQSVHLHTFQPNILKHSRGIFLSRDSFENYPDYQEIPEEFLFNLQSTLVEHFFVLVTPLQSPQPKREAHRSPQMSTPRHNLVMLEVEDILPSPLTALVLPPPVPEPVCEMQTPALFTMAQSSPQPQSVDTGNYARVNPLPSTATSSSSSGELHLFIGSDTSSPSIAVGPTSSSQELLLQGNIQVRQPPSLFTAHTAVSTSQPPPQPTSIPSWADEVPTAEQTNRSTPETVVLNWAYSGRNRGPLINPTPVMLTPYTHTYTHTAHMYPHRGTADHTTPQAATTFPSATHSRSTHVDG